MIFNWNNFPKFQTTKAFLPKMIENDHGHIVTIASMAGHVGIAKLVDYCATKYAAVGFDESLRLELDQEGIQGVKTSLICPYFIEQTGMFNYVQSRYMPKLNAGEVADRIVTAIRREEVHVMIPNTFRYFLLMKWFVGI